MMDLQVGTNVEYVANGEVVKGKVIEVFENIVKVEWECESCGKMVNQHEVEEFEYYPNFKVVAEPEFDRVFVEFMPNYEAGIYKMFEIKRKVKHNEKGAYIQYKNVKHYLKNMELVEDYGDFGCYKYTPKF